MAALRRLGASILALVLLAVAATPAASQTIDDQLAMGAFHDARLAAEPWLDGDGAEEASDADGKVSLGAVEHPEFQREDTRVGRRHHPPGTPSWLMRWLRRSHASQGPPAAESRAS